MQVCRLGQDGFHEVDSSTLPTLLASESETIWVDMVGPTDEDVTVMHDVFKFHALAIEDTRNQEQRPKAEEYDDHMFIILNPLQYKDNTVDFRELDVFVGKNYIVVVHPTEEPVIQAARQRIQQSHISLPRTPSYVLYTLMDVTIDTYFPFLDEAGDSIETIENSILEKPDPEALNQLFHLKRSLLNMWRVVWPQREVFNILMHHNIEYLDQQALQYYLRDVADHLMWVADMVNTLRDTLTSMMDLYMSSVSNGLNIVVNRLSIITIIIGVFTVISGFYGMNFLNTWPPFDAPWGVPFALATMVVSALMLVGIFRWLNLFK
jgi:magnesium transporter